MGLYMSSPCRDVDAEEGIGNNLQYAVGEMQGWRSHMEDSHIACLDMKVDLCDAQISDERQAFLNGIAVFGVFDGHGGKEVSLFVKDHFLRELLRLPSFQEDNIEAALMESFHNIDHMLNNIAYDSILKEYKRRPNPSDLAYKASRASASNSPTRLTELSDKTSSPSDPGSCIPPTIVNSIFASGHIQQDDESNLSTEDIITQLAAMDAIIEFEKERERERESKIGKDIDKTDTKKLSDGKDKLTDAELLELKEKEDEDRYFNDVLRANTEDDAGEVEKSIPRASVVDVTDRSVLTEEEEEENYFESIVQSVQNRPSGYLDEGCDNHDYTGSGGVGRGIGEEYGIGVISGCNNTNTKQNKVDNSSVPNNNDINSIAESDTIVSKSVNSDPLNPSKNQNTEIDFTESLTMTALEKSNAPVTSPNVHSKHRPSTSLSFASPSTPTSSSSPPAPFASLPAPATMPVINPFGKENRSKTDDEENRVQAELLSIEAIENIMNKKRQSAGGNLKDQSSDRIDLSIMSSAVTATKNRQIQNLQLNEKKVVGENGDDNELKNEFNGVEEEATVMTDVATTSHNPPPPPALALTPTPIIPFRGVNGQPVTVYSNGNPSCNLPDHRVSAGCTAVLAVVKDQRLYVANAGDSRGVLCRAGVAIPLSDDHKPNKDREYSRITAAGGFVNPVGRINGNLNVSRSLGDLKYKQVEQIPCEEQMITAQPDISVTDLQSNDSFFILGCDGIWDCLTCQEACDLVSSKLEEGLSLIRVVDEVLKECLASNPKLTAGVGGDNMTCLIVLLNRTAKINENIDPKNALNTKENKNIENVSKNNEKEHENGNSCNEKNARKSNYKFQLHSPP